MWAKKVPENVPNADHLPVSNADHVPNSKADHVTVPQAADGWRHRGVQRRLKAGLQLPDDRAALLQGQAPQDLRLRLRLLYPEQQEHLRAHLRVPQAGRGHHRVDDREPFRDAERQLLLRRRRVGDAQQGGLRVQRHRRRPVEEYPSERTKHKLKFQALLILYELHIYAAPIFSSPPAFNPVLKRSRNQRSFIIISQL